MADFSRWVRLGLIDAGMEDAAAAKFERALRREWGGARVYIAKHTPPPVTSADVGKLIQSGMKPTQAIRVLGLTRPTGFRILASRGRR